MNLHTVCRTSGINFLIGIVVSVFVFQTTPYKIGGSLNTKPLFAMVNKMRFWLKESFIALLNFNKKRRMKKSFSQLEKETKLLSIGIYTLIIIITAALMLIIFNLILIE